MILQLPHYVAITHGSHYLVHTLTFLARFPTYTFTNKISPRVDLLDFLDFAVYLSSPPSSSNSSQLKFLLPPFTPHLFPLLRVT